MKNMTTKELTKLGDDLNRAKIYVLHKHGFSSEEIHNVTGVPESVVRNIIRFVEEQTKVQKTES